MNRPRQWCVLPVFTLYPAEININSITPSFINNNIITSRVFASDVQSASLASQGNFGKIIISGLYCYKFVPDFPAGNIHYALRQLIRINPNLLSCPMSVRFVILPEENIDRAAIFFIQRPLAQLGVKLSFNRDSGTVSASMLVSLN